GLTNQEIKVNNVLSNSTVKLFKADNTPLNVTNITHGSGYSSVVTVSDALPNGGIKAKSSISMNNVTYTTQDEHGQVVTVTRNESVDSNDSASVTVTPQLQATTEGAIFIKGGDGFDFGHVERFIQNPPHGATVAWHDNPDTWKNTVGNTHKNAVVTLPNGQGTRNVEVPVKVYPVANAKAPSRDVKGQNLTNGTDAMNYITFDPNTNTNGITAAWANRQQPNNQQAGVQHLNVDVTYPGISAAKRVPVTVNVYQFELPQTTYTTTVGGTLASGTQASGYAQMQNATGLPTDGFTYKWNNTATGTNDANWAAMNKPNVAKVVNAKYDVIYNGRTFATSLPAKFVVKDVQPAKPTVTETAAGAITITPGANQTVNTHAGNVTTYADKLVIKRNGNVVTTFTRRNNTSPWVKEASAATVAGITGTNNGITVAAGTFNPADTIQVVATQGNGETISDEQRSDDFTVVAPQPNQATTKIWQNGHIDITPNNPSGHLINPTQAMDIAYTEKVGNGAEHSKTLNAVRGQNNQWTIANKPDYVTLDAQTGKVTFNANTIKPNSAITITPKAGTGHSASSNPSTLTAPAAHTVNTTEIVKDYGSNVTAAEINNAVQVANKRTATIKNGTAMPTNLAGGSTTTIPVTVTYNDGSTEEVQESIFTKADKRELITAKNHLDDPVSTDGKKPGTITQYNNAIHNAQQQINTAKTEAQQVINNERATPQQVSDALTKVRAAQTKIDQAKALLQNKEDNSQLVTSKNNLQSSVNQVPSTAGMTQQSIDNYNAKKREAETEITAAQRVIDNGDATAQQISDEKHRVDNALTALNQAKHDLTADTHALEQAVQQLNRTGTTTGKKPASITAYNNSMHALQSDLTSAKNSANTIIQKPIRSVQEVQTALTNVNRVNERLTQAINQLVPLADNSALRTAKTKLDEEINKSVTTDGMTQSSIQAYENAKRAGQTESTNAQNVINNGDATDQQIAAEKTKVEEKYNSLKQAIAGLTPDLAPLQTAKTQLQNDIDQPTSTTGMTSASIEAFNEKLSAARTKIQEIDRVLASHPDVATIRQNVTAANAAKSALDQARNGLTVDKAPLENAKAQLQQSIDTQTSTTGMTQDSVNAYNAKLTAARNKIQQINQVLAGSPTVDQINTNTSAANQAKSDLDHARQALTPDKASLQTAKTQLEQSINQPTDTTGMTTASLNAYNQKLQAARQKLTEINQVLNGNPTVQNINDKVTEANQAKDQLNTARQGLTLDRQPALTTLHGASNLNQAQQNNFTQQINAAQNHAALETIKSNITALNNAMTKLKESVADNNTIKSGQNYTDATPANKQAYDNAVNAAKGVIGETTNPTMDVNTVNQKAASVKSTKDALDGQQNLQRAKTEATNAITHASDLNQAQKNALTQQVNSAQNVQAVNDIKQTTQSLNTAMTGLKRGVANHNQVVQSDNYVNADTNKKNDYNNAYNHANDIINGNAQHPVITPSDVNNALSNVTSKEHALNGEAKLNAAKQEANTALGHLNNLNNAQRQNLQSQINGAHQIDAVNTIKQNATNLNSAMGNLRQAVADKDQVKRTEDYADADTAKQNAYNSAVSSAETIINQTTNPTMSVDDVNRATSAVTSNKNALNGDEKLAQSKTDAARAIDALPHLNNAQKADVKSKINAASNIAGVNTVKQQGTDLNTAMGNLQGAINDEQTTLNSQNYQDATPSKKTAYTNAVQAAKDILNKSNGQNKTKDQVTEAMNQVNSAKNNLDGTRLLDQAKQTAKQQLNNMTHLTTAQKTNLTNQINNGTTVAGVQTVQSNANTLDQAMNTLRQSIANKDATKASEDYVDANNDKQTAYNNAVAAAETIINANSNPEMNPSTITQKAEQVNSSKTALNGDENLAAAKQNAKTYLNTLTSITDAQKNNLISQITSATRVSGVDTVKQNAQHLDQAMASLQNGINNESQVKSSEKYRDADTNKQQEYDNAITAAKAILNKQHGPNTAQNDVEAALRRVNTAKDALNGDAKLIAAQNAAKQHLGTLTHITTAQRNDLTNQISQATNLAGVESVKESANSLDGAMGNLQTAINDKSGTLASQNFLDADEQKRNAYNQAVSAAETILNKQTGPNTAKTAVEQALNNVNNAKHALNGTQNLNNAKQAAITAINGASDLNQKQKDALKAQANGAQRVSNAQDVQHNATELNTAMGTLKHAIADKTNTLASSKYVNADSTKQNAYTTKVTNAENIISGTPTVVTTPSEVTAAANQVNSAKQELNGDERLRVAKQNANTAIDALTQLNTPQKAKLKEQVGQANRLEDVQSVQTNGQSLNNAMKGLRDSIANETTVKASQNYTDASPNNQSTYNSAVSNAKGIINQTNNPTMDTSAITQATTQVNNAKNGLNGAENLRNAQNTAKQNLNTLSHLTNNQKSAISSQIDRAGHVSEVTAAKNAATELNTQMGNLEQAIHDQNTVKQGVNFTDADKAKRDAYTNAVSRAETILNKTQGANTSKQDVEAAIQNVTSAKNALNGDQNVTNAKNAAKNALNNLTSINNAQKRDLTTKIDQATTVAGVEAVSNTGTQLNTAMANLQNGINDKANTLASENYHDADSDKKTAYTQAVTNAENILNKNSGSNLDKAAVENALSQVANAKGALNGNHNLEQAKSNANTTINGLQHLTTAQKDKLKQQVQQAQNVAGVDNVKSSANTLNGAMGTLRNSIQDNTATKNGQNYLDATESNKTNYNNAVDSANGVINATSNPNMDANAINQIATQVTSTKNALNGTHNLTQAKQTASNAIDGATNLNKAQKDALKAQVTSAQRVANVTSIQQTANELNTAMGQLQHGIDDENVTKQTQKYRDAEQSKKTAYDQAVAAAKAILNKQTGSNSDKAAVDRALQQVTSTKDALNGDAKLAEAKAAAKQNLGTLNHITNAQRTDLEGQINQATTVDGVNTVKTNANTLDGAMNSLQGSINDKDATLRNQNYLDADESKRNAYTQAVTAAEGILNKQTGGNTSKADVDNALNAVTRAKAALNGADNLRNAKTSATNTINGLPNLTQLQKDNLKHQVEQAQNVAGVNGVKDKGNTLNTAMGALRTSIQNDNTTKTSQNYLDASDSNKNNYNTAVNNANGVINATNNPNMDANAINGMANQVNTTKAALNGAQNLAQAKTNATNTINNAHDLNQKQKDALKTQVNNAQRVSDANNVQRTATELNGAMTALKVAIADKERTKASGNYVNADQEKRQAYDSKVTNAENIISGTPNATLTVNDVNSAASQVNAAKTALNGDNNLRVAKEHANNTIDGLVQLNNVQKAKLKEQVQSATTLDGVQTVKNSSQTLNTAMKGLRDSIANEATIKAGQNYTDASPNNRSEYDSAVTAAKAIIGQTTSPTMNAQEINQAKDQVTAKQQALNGQENLRTAQTNAKQHLNGLSDLTDAQKDAVKRQIEGATHVNEVTQAQNNADALNTAMTNLKNGIQDQNTIKQGVNFTDADEAKRNAYTNAVTQAEQILNKAQGPNTSKDGVETALQNVQRAKNELNGNQNVANAKTTAKNALNNLTSINNAQKEALKTQIEGATTVAGVNQVSTTASELNTAMSNLQRGINDEAATKAAQKYTDADREKQTAYNDAVTAAKTLLDKTAGSNDNKAAVEQALQRVNTAKTALNGDARLNEAKNTAKQQLATMSHLTNAQKANLTEQIERGTTVAGVQGIQANAGTLDQAMNQLRQSIASKDTTKSSEDYQDANADLQNAYNRAVSDAEGIISATNNPEMNPDTINQKASQVNSAKSALNGDEKLAAAKQTAKTDIGRLTDLNNAQRTAANAEVDQAPNLAAVTAAKNKATSLNTAMGNLKHALAEKDNTKRSVNYTDADQPKQQAYDTAVTQAEAITNANGSNANETQVQAALNQLNQAKNDLNGDNKVAQAKETAKRALASYSNLNNAQSTAATSQIDNATTVADVTAAQNTANELNTAMGQLQNGINDQNTVKQQVNFTDADQGKKDAYTNAVTNAQGILDKANGQNMTKAQVEAALNQVTTAKNALNGDANVRQAKSDAKANLGTLTHLNNAQKQDLTSQIEGATTVNGVNSVKTKAQDLDGAMQRLESAIANKDQTKASENYIDADPTKKTAFDNAIIQAESYLNKDHGANKDKQAVEQAIQSVTSTENALNGDANLQRAKTEATQAIDNLTHLNTPQKTALKQQVNAAQRVSGVTDLKNSATSLNNAMDQLKQAIADHDTIVAGGNYTNASPDKQGAYTDAYNAAKNIVNGSPNVITNAADVTAATQRVNNAETGLNGDTNLATAKQQAKDALRQMTHLSDAQKQSITGQIDSATQVTGVQSVKDNATNLDNAMNQLRNSIANKDEVKASQPYVDADTDKQNAYNTAVTSAENIINATSQPTLNPSAVTQAANQVNTNKTALNGAQNLANKKQETTANINQLSHLNNAQKQDLNTQVTNAPNISTVNQVKTKAEQLDQAMERLINGIQDKDQVKQSVNFTDADPEKQTAYNNAVTAAENIINQANGTNANQSQVEAALSTVTTTKQALNGDRKVTDAKNNANQRLSTLDNLNNAQKGAVTGNINQAHTVAEVTQAIQTAQELNTAMGNLKNSLNDKDTTLGSQNFADADPEKKNAYNEAVRNAENILNKSTGTNVPKDQVEAAMNQVNTTKAALNGTQNLEKAKQHANTAIDGLSHLTNAQKDALKQLVQQSTTVAEAQGNEQKANNVDAAMDKLRQSIADNATTKQNQNYTDASPNKKDAYNNAVTTAQGIIDQTTNPTLDPTVINQAAGQVSTTKNALNGNENLEAAKQQATQSLGSLDNLNNAQKQAVTNQINGAHTVDEANQIKQNAQNLNTAMGNLKQAIADKDATKATVNFTDADQAKQQVYNTAVTNAENIISKANGGNATQTEVEQAIQQVNATKQALNGNANVQHAKDEATALINSSNDLNQAQKDALKQQVQNATTVAGVNNVKQTAQELNNAMTQLKQGIADKEQTKADGNFVNADPDKQNAYNQAVAKAEALISGTPDVVVTPSEITAALNKVTQAKNDLNGNTNLATAKQNVQQAIDQLPNLNQAQRDEYNKQITQATLVPNVNAIQQAATTLNDAMTQLKQGIANKAQIKGSENYHDADTDKQTAYDNAVTKAEELLKQTTNPTMDPNTIQQALTKVNDTNQALNGNQKLADAKQDAKTTLGTLDHLNDAQKQALTTQVEQAPDIATVNNVKQNAQNLNNAMTNLNNALQDKTETLNSINFTDADQAKKDAYTNAVANAEGILSKANGSNASQTEVEQAMQRVNAAKQALNGNDNVQRAKDAAKQVITNANDLNQAQKDALKQQVDAAQTVANVNTIKQTAQDLNQAMTQLKQGIADKDQTKANGNFVNADTDKQNAYNNAVAHAEQIISGTPNANVDPQQVAQALQQVNQAKGDLNGNHNLQVAKDNANTAIDQLPNLNQPQKTALKDQVSHAELVTGVNAIKQNADALNNAMGTLKQQIQANSQVPQSVDFTQADQDKQQAYNNAANQAQQIANGTPTPVLAPDTVTQAVTTMNQAKDALNGDEKLAQAKQDALANLDTLRDLNQPQRDALRNQINQAQALATVEQTKQNAQNVNTAMGNLKQGIANKDTVKASENYHDADVDKQTAYTNAVSQAEGIINQTTNPTLNPDDITRALTQVTDAKNSLNGEAKLATEKQNAKDAVSGMTHLNDAQKQALKGQIDQSPEIATVNQVKQTATSLDQAMDQLSQAINDKDQILADGNYLNADPDKQNAYKQAVAKAEALLNKQSGTNEVQAQVESITNEVNAAKQALNGNDNLANAKQQAKQQLANLTHLNDAQKQSFESQITQAPLVTDVTTINQKAQTLDHAMELLRNSVADNQTTLASEDYHDATAQRQNDYNKAVTAANNIINQTTSPTMNPDDVNGATTQVNNTKVALDGDENLAAAKQQANNRLDQLDHLNNAQKQQLQSQITQSSDIAAVNGHKQTAESLNTAMGNLINAIADHQAVEQRGNFINADTDKQTAYNTAVNEAAAMINKQTGQNANQTEVEQAITKVQTTLQALNGDHNLQVAKTNATQAIDALTSLNDPQKTALKDQVTAATLVTAVHQIEQNANTLNQAMHGLRQSIQDNAATKANSKYINEDQPEQQNYDQAVQAANNIINEQTATLDNNAINQAAATVNTTKAALHGDVKLQNDKDHAKQTVSQLAHLNNAQKHMEDTLIDSETTRTVVKQDLTEAQALDQLMDALQQSIADKDATRASSAYVNAEPNKKQAYDEAVQNAESIIAGLNNPTINKGNVSSATQAVISSKNALDGVERLAQDKQTAGNSLNHLDQLTPAQQQALENQINNATTRDKVAEIIAQAQALNEAMKALKESIKDQPQTEASSKFINEDQAQKDAYTQAVQHAKDLINKTTNPTLAKSIIDQATQAVTDAKNNLHGDQKLAQDKQRATETLNNLSNLNTPQRQALENQINNAATRGEVAQKLTEAQALNQALEALRNSIQDQQQTEAGSKFINEDKPQKDAYQAAVQNAKDLINQTNNPTLDKAQVEQLTQAVNQAKDNLHGDQKLADDKQHAVTDLNQLNGLNNPQRQALESQINNAATRDEVAQKLAEAKALDQAMQALRNSIQDQQQTESGSKFINEDKPQKDAYQAAVQNAKDLINQTGNPTLDKSQVEQLTQAVTTAKDNLHGDQKLARDQQQAVTTVNALPNLNHAQQQALTDAINAAPTRTEVAQHVQTATELDHAMETLKNKVDQVNTDKAQPNYTEASTDKKEAVDQALQAAQSITDPTNGSNANKDAVEQALTKLQEKENELNGNERVAEAKTQAKQTIDQLTHLNADQIATAKQNIDQATKLQPIAELVDQATQLNQSMDQLQQAVNEHANVEQTVDYTQADSDKQNAYKQAIADAENVLKQNANKQQVDQALQNILNAKQALNGDERVALAKTNGKHDIDQLNALNNAQQDGFKGRIDQSNELNQIQQIVDEAKALNRAMDQLSQEITGNEGRTKGSTNYVNADTQVKQVYDEAVDKAKQALDKSTGQNLTAEQVIKLNDAITAAKKALNGEERLNNRKAEALQRLDQLTHLNNAQRQLAIQQINNAETLNKASRAINRATKLDNAMGAVQQYIDEQHLGVISSTNYINADDNLKANYDNAIANAAHELDKVQGNAIAKAEAEQLKQNIIDAQNALNGDQNLANAKDKANAFVNSLNGLNQQQQDLAHKAINNADTVTDVTDIVNNQIDLNDAMETLKHLVDNEIPNAEQTVNYQNADDNAKTNFDDAKRLANTLLNSDNTNVNDINGAIQTVNDAIHNLNGDQRLQDAKDKAIQSINQALANKLKEIEASNATDQDKLIAKNKAEELANSIINNINKATSNQAVSQVQTAGNHAIEQVHANEIPKAKIDANKDVDKQVQSLIDEIDRNPNLTDKEKQALKDRINQILQQGHNGINNAMTKEAIEQAKERLAQA
ncbi:TPA: hyperosmolarity resistance protein Ebh, partial [Staphylococcus aureus]